MSNYIYDLSLLISQQVSSTPSGIMRVDLRYAEYFVREQAGNTTFVRQIKNEFFIVDLLDAKALTEHLHISWNTQADNPEGYKYKDHNLSFRLHHCDLWQPDFEAFYSQPFTERFNFLMAQELTNILGSEFSWTSKLPHFIKILYAFFASMSKKLAMFYIRVAQFIGVYLHTNKFSSAMKFISRAGKKKTNLATNIRSNESSYSKEQYYYVTAAANTGLPFQALNKLEKLIRLKYVVYVHDLLTIKYPEYFLPDSNQKEVSNVTQLLDLDPLLITNSDTTKACIIDFASQHSKVIKPVVTSFIGVEPHFICDESRKERSPAKKYFVFISTIEPRKNHLLLLNIWREIALSQEIETPELYLIGKRGWENENVIDMVERCLSLKGFVHELTDIKDDRLINLLTGARAMLYPSFGEGWGMPIAEALSLGTPVICSDIPELRESGQNIPEYISPIDGLSWKNAILEYCAHDSTLRKQQLQRIEGYIPPTWEDHFKTSIDAIQSS